jgi:hypothetical protein
MARADHVYVSRGLYTHHGIDAGDGTVIHFTGEPGSKKNACIARSSSEQFLQGAQSKTRGYGTRDEADATIARAESQLGTSQYHLLVSNCEHFATWCCTGRKASSQVRGATSLTGHGAVAGTTAAATTGVVGAVGTVAGVSGPGIMSAWPPLAASLGAGRRWDLQYSGRSRLPQASASPVTCCATMRACLGTNATQDETAGSRRLPEPV